LLNPDINSAFDESTPSITKDGRYLFYTASYSDREQLTRPEIYISRRINGLWTKGVPFEINNIDSTAIFAHPSISPSGRYLYFVSDMRGGYGGKDIWRARLSSSFKVDTVENMGPIINSSGDELYPYVRDDNSIYFSSDGHPGMGGLDIFEAYYNDKMNEWIVENIKSPINSSQDDFGITFEPKVEKGYFSSNRNDVRGYHHIYSFEYLPARIIIEGFAVDQDDEFISGATVSVVGSDGFQSNFITSSEGVYKFEAEKDKTYLLMASADGFLNQKKMLHTANLESDTTYYVDFEMIPYNKPVILDNVFYDLNSAKLRPESKSALDELIALLNEHPEISIELTAHTDRLGDEGYNINLSANRAKSVVDYLVQNGIDQYRLKAKGCGKSAPKVINRIIAETYDFLKTGDILNEEFIGRLTPEQQKLSDQLNRRTEFRVLNPE
jgi:peptidoglycan-associated lipoprotein